MAYHRRPTAAAVNSGVYRPSPTVASDASSGRAADLVLFGPEEIQHVEFERHLSDWQAQLRAGRIKQELLMEMHHRPVRFVMATIEHEARRQVEVLEDGGTIVQETRLFDPGTGTTRSMRSKEDAHDYRYFPDPDLLPLELDDQFLSECRDSLPELPDAKRRRYIDDLGLSTYNAGVLTAEVDTARWFEALLLETATAQGKPPAEVAKQAANWLISEFFGALNKAGHSLENSPVSHEGAAGLLALIGKGTISGSIAKQVLEKMLETGDSAAAIVEREGLIQESDSGAIEAAVDHVLAANADKVAEYKGGKEALFGFFVGQTMKAMQGKANPQIVNEALKAKLR